MAKNVHKEDFVKQPYAANMCKIPHRQMLMLVMTISCTDMKTAQHRLFSVFQTENMNQSVHYLHLDINLVKCVDRER